MGIESSLISYTLGGVRTDSSSSSPPPITMFNLLSIEELIQLIETGMVELSDDLMIRLEFNPITECYEESNVIY